ncbi:putative MPP superfamily phosphohydrolase [Pedobacter sp. UYP30]|uniref:metallophosphoesterase family protein n=1 Tax=Pedobacter sp. UYP30 TaxID=1756400 RepID=UPI003398165C
MKNTLCIFILICCYSQIRAQQKTSDRKIEIDTASFSGGKLPISSKPLNDAPDKLQFAIISDINGGNIPGVFSDAKNKLNELQPSMVLSIGDLIDGYTTDSVLVKKEWNQFNSMVDSLDMPFFYVSGNHDVSNPFLKQQWKKRFGRTYYYFVYKNTLFLALDTEDGKTDGIGKEQIDYVKKVLREHQNVRWTFVFMHRPLWSYGNEQGYEQIGTALKGRDYTLFSGHHHNYMSGERNGQKHYILATTGGGAYGRGAKFGEFQHITWVTLNKTPTVVNIALDGIIKDDIVSEAIYPEIQSLRMGEWLKPKPFVAASELVDSAQVTLTFKNPTKSVLTVSGQLAESKLWSIVPRKLNVTVPANGTVDQVVTFASLDAGKKLDLNLLDHLDFALTGTYHLNNQDYSLSASSLLKIDWQRTIAFDKDLSSTFFKNQLDTANLIKVVHPQYIQEDWDWHGLNDAFLKFKIRRDKRFLYVNALIYDDKFLISEKDQDGASFYISGLPGKTTTINIEVKPKLQGKEQVISNVKGVAHQTKWIGKNQWLVQLKIPVSGLDSIEKLRFNMSYRDIDDLSNSKPSVVFWRPKWGSPEDYNNSGMFFIPKN